MKIIAHRGWSGSYPENTMLAFKKAEEAGADGIELDVHLSKDGEVMIIHDEALIRTAGRSGVVSDYTRCELESISAGKTQRDEYGFTPIPALEEFLDFLKGTSMMTNIELKTAPTYYPGIEEKTLALVKRFGLEDRIIFSSFNWLSVIKLKGLAPNIPGGLLIDSPKIENIGYQIHDLSLDAYHPGFKLLDDSAVRDCKEHSVDINVWTVNEEEDMKRCIAWDVAGLITNHPDKAIALLQASV